MLETNLLCKSLCFCQRVRATVLGTSFAISEQCIRCALCHNSWIFHQAKCCMV